MRLRQRVGMWLRHHLTWQSCRRWIPRRDLIQAFPFPGTRLARDHSRVTPTPEGPNRTPNPPQNKKKTKRKEEKGRRLVDLEFSPPPPPARPARPRLGRTRARFHPRRPQRIAVRSPRELSVSQCERTPAAAAAAAGVRGGPEAAAPGRPAVEGGPASGSAAIEERRRRAGKVSSRGG